MTEVRQAAVRGYLDRGPSGFANILLPSGEGVFLSLAASGLRLHRLILWGRWPGRRLHTCDADAMAQTVRVLARDIATLPKLPDKAALDSFLVIAARAISDPSVYREYPHDEEGETMTPLAVLTRAALAEPDSDALARRLRRAAATP